MFHKWHKRVLEQGAQAQGQVYGLTRYGTDGDYGVKVRVKLPDGSIQEFEKGPLNPRRVGRFFEGSVVPVRYDPADTSKVVLDTVALESAQGQATAGRQAQLDQAFEHLGGAAPAGDLQSQVLQMATQGQGGVVDLRDASATPTDRVAKLEALKQQGLIDAIQFEAAKAKILGES